LSIKKLDNNAKKTPEVDSKREYCIGNLLVQLPQLFSFQNPYKEEKTGMSLYQASGSWQLSQTLRLFFISLSSLQICAPIKLPKEAPSMNSKNTKK